MRIELSETNKFIQIYLDRTKNGSTRICKYEEGIASRRQPIGEIKIKQEDLAKVLVAALLISGMEVKEILSELFSQITDYNAEKIEYLMRVGY